MERRFRLLGAVVLVGFTLSFLLFVGPWPVVTSKASWRRPLERTSREVSREADVVRGIGSLDAGWAVSPLVLPEGVPLAGYGDRLGEPSRGYHDPLEVGALVVRGRTTSDTGSGPASERPIEFAIVASDLLIVPHPIAEQVRARVEVPVLFTASHTHSGPGGAMRGLVARAFGGRYDLNVERAVLEAMVAAIEEARADLRPVTASHGALELPGLIRNRTRDATAGYPLTDPYLDLLHFETVSEGSLSLVRYSAHAIIVGAGNMELSAGYPGYLRSAVERLEGGQAFFLAGAVGSMSARVAGDDDDFTSARRYGELLAEAASSMVMTSLSSATVGVVDVTVTAPPVQLRLTPWFRISPLFLATNGIRREVRFTAFRIGEFVLIGFPGDLSGEIAAELRAWGRRQGIEIVPTSFAGSYLGYISPDAYYDELYEPDGLAYETGLMSWAGPGQERFFVGLARAAVDALFRE